MQNDHNVIATPEDRSNSRRMRSSLRRGTEWVERRLRELRRDVAETLATLLDLHRAVAMGLVTGTIKSTANEIGIPRRAVKRIIGEIREALDGAGLRDYV